MVARAYIRHPSDVPIELAPEALPDVVRSITKDISIGGLCFSSKRPIEVGAAVKVKIPITTPAFEGKARVIWCLASSDGYDVGIEFCAEEDAYRARMVEQVCHIEHYRLWVKEVEGRDIDSECAAREWISKFAEGFPTTSWSVYYETKEPT